MKTLGSTIRSVETVLDVAIHLEMAGQAFYEAALGTVTDAPLGQILAFLAEQEKKHFEFYKDLAEKMAGSDPYQEALFGEYGMYIDLLVRDVTGGLSFDPAMGPRQIVDMAVRFEKDTLLFFSEIRPIFDAKDQEAVMAIMQEERRHIRMLLAYDQNVAEDRG